MKIRDLFIFSILCCFMLISACSDDDDGGGEDFDPAAQALIDDDRLVEFLQSHHYIPPVGEEVFGVIDTILEGENVSSLFSNIKTEPITDNDVGYKLYYWVNNEGKNTNPTKADSILVNYRGFTLDSVKFDERLNYTWLSLTGVIRGWQFGFEKFKDGDQVVLPGEPVDFENTGNGILFIPSGLAYGNLGTAGIAPNEPLIFFIDLGLVERADHDNDGILSFYEDVDKDSNVNNDDTDGDNSLNYLDADDDGDGIPTREENADPNGDGNPEDAVDTDGDGTPDYLDPDNS